MNKLSIIIPVYNEESAINKLIAQLQQLISNQVAFEIIVVDGGSTDATVAIVRNNPDVILVHSAKGSAKQMNAGAIKAIGDVFYFLHSDTYPPLHFDLSIRNELEKGNKAGCFRMKFDSKHPVLLISQWFTRINHICCRGGDQSLFIEKALFNAIGQFNESLIIYEDNDIIRRLYAKNQFVVINKTIVTSARKYLQIGVWRLQYIFAMIHLKRKLGYSNESILHYYNTKIIK